MEQLLKARVERPGESFGPTWFTVWSLDLAWVKLSAYFFEGKSMDIVTLTAWNILKHLKFGHLPIAFPDWVGVLSPLICDLPVKFGLDRFRNWCCLGLDFHIISWNTGLTCPSISKSKCTSYIYSYWLNVVDIQGYITFWVKMPSYHCTSTSDNGLIHPVTPQHFISNSQTALVLALLFQKGTLITRPNFGLIVLAENDLRVVTSAVLDQSRFAHTTGSCACIGQDGSSVPGKLPASPLACSSDAWATNCPTGPWDQRWKQHTFAVNFHDSEVLFIHHFIIIVMLIFINSIIITFIFTFTFAFISFASIIVIIIITIITIHHYHKHHCHHYHHYHPYHHCHHHHHILYMYYIVVYAFIPHRLSSYITHRGVQWRPY